MARHVTAVPQQPQARPHAHGAAALAAYLHLAELGQRPAVQLRRPDKGDVHAQTSVDTRAVEAEVDACRTTEGALPLVKRVRGRAGPWRRRRRSRERGGQCLAMWSAGAYQRESTSMLGSWPGSQSRPGAGQPRRGGVSSAKGAIRTAGKRKARPGGGGAGGGGGGGDETSRRVHFRRGEERASLAGSARAIRRCDNIRAQRTAWQEHVQWI